MGRRKIEESEKRITKAVSLSKENILQIENNGVENLSKLVDWLIQEHFGKLLKQTNKI